MVLFQCTELSIEGLVLHNIKLFAMYSAGIFIPRLFIRFAFTMWHKPNFTLNIENKKYLLLYVYSQLNFSIQSITVVTNILTE